MISISDSERERLGKMPRYLPGDTDVCGRRTYFSDAASLLSTLDGVFGDEIYRFTSANDKPFIIDCGANIGISIMYFKILFPDCRIIAFEPVPAIFETLSKNISEWNFANVTIIQKALWKEDTTLEFWKEGADGGRLNDIFDNRGSVRVQTDLLSRYISSPVDFIKLDVEGAECEVISEISGLLGKVERLYIEYHSFVNRPQRLDEILCRLNSASMRYYVRGNGTLVRNPFISRGSYLNIDMLLHVFALRESG